jgi:prevent-host-death family protein
MQRVGSREFKNRMGRYLRAVRQGHTLILTDRGKAVARVSPAAEDPENLTNDLEERLREMVAQGFIRLARKPFPKFRPVKSKGKSASQMIIEDRR